MGKYSCEACKKKCKKEAIRLQDKYFHVACFTCRECKSPLATDGFFTKDGAHYCAADYQRLFGTKCHACGKAVEGELTTVLGKTYHQDCFKCSKCQRKFQPGEKATFGNNSEHWCHKCHEEQQQQQPEVKAASSASVSHAIPSTSENTAAVNAESAVAVEIPMTPLSPGGSALEKNEKLQSHVVAEPSEQNGVVKKETPVADSDVPKEVTAVKTQKLQGNQPRVFGMPDNKFFNISYLQRSNTDFKRGPLANATAKEPSVTHYHRPISDDFSYTNLRRDFKSELGFQDKKELVLLSKRPDARVKSLAPIERDDWPSPPEPAAAYPELLREKVPQQPTEEVKSEEEKVSKEIDELSKMTDSGAAAVILRDLKKKRSVSPTLDPRFASMTPSAALETHCKPRYDQPYFASPSRDLDMRQRVLEQERNRKSLNGALIAPSHFGGVVKSGHGLCIVRPGTSFDERNGYQSDVFDVETRPRSSAGILQTHSLDVYDDRVYGDVDPTTGLRHSSNLKALTLPQAFSGRFLIENNLSSHGTKELEAPKIFPYEVLCQKNFENLIGVDKDALERHLSKDEFERVFHMNQVEFSRLPVWERNETKLKLGLL